MAVSNVGQKRKAAEKGNYGTVAILLFAILAIVIYVGNFMIVGFVSEKRKEWLDIKAKYDESVRENQSLTRKVKKDEREMVEVERKAARWKDSDRKLNKPWTINARDRLSTLARNQVPSVVVDNTSIEPSQAPEGDSPGKLGQIKMEVRGKFESLLSWLMEAEHELDTIRIAGAEWRARNPQIVELILSVEVDNHE